MVNVYPKSIGDMWKVPELKYSFLSNRYQKCILYGRSPYWTQVKAGVLQGSILDLCSSKCIYMIRLRV